MSNQLLRNGRNILIPYIHDQINGILNSINAFNLPYTSWLMLHYELSSAGYVANIMFLDIIHRPVFV
jgi:hypothetical protein